MLLVQTLVELDAGDPIFYCSDPFEMIHKLKMRPAFQLSKKHTSTIAKDILKKVWVRSGMSLMGAGLRNVFIAAAGNLGSHLIAPCALSVGLSRPACCASR